MDRNDADRAWVPPRAPNACCREVENLVTLERDEHVQVRKCRVCGCRHFRALMPMMSVGVRVGG